MDIDSFYISGDRNDSPVQNKLFIGVFYLWRKHDVTLFSAFQGACPSCTWHNIELLWRTTADFVAPDMWPPNSSDLNLVDYAMIWSVIQQRVCKTRSWHRWAATASTACVVQLGAAAVADWWYSWPMPNTLVRLCSCQKRTFWNTLWLSICAL